MNWTCEGLKLFANIRDGVWIIDKNTLFKIFPTFQFASDDDISGRKIILAIGVINRNIFADVYNSSFRRICKVSVPKYYTGLWEKGYEEEIYQMIDALISLTKNDTADEFIINNYKEFMKTKIYRHQS